MDVSGTAIKTCLPGARLQILCSSQNKNRMVVQQNKRQHQHQVQTAFLSYEFGLEGTGEHRGKHRHGVYVKRENIGIVSNCVLFLFVKQ